MTTFIDTNVLIYLMKPTDGLHSWAKEQFQKCKEKGPVIISDIVYAEFSVGMVDKATTDKVISELACLRLGISDQALFSAGRAFLKYKQNGGKAEKILPDFVIGAQAEDTQSTLLTGDKRYFPSLFPALRLISP